MRGDKLLQFRAGDVIKSNSFLNILAAVSRDEIDVLLPYIVDSLEVISHSDRKAQGSYTKPQLLFHFVQEIKGVLTFAVELIDKNNHRNIAHATYLYEFFCLFLNPFGHINHYDDTIHSSKRTEGILGEVLVTGGIQDVYLMIFVSESQDRGSHRDSPLAFYFHKVGSSSFLDLVGLDCSCFLDSSPEEEQLLGQSRFSRIRVRDDAESTALANFLF